MKLSNLTYLLSCLSFSTIFGAAVYEHTAVWPNAFAALPQSLTAFQGSYKLNNAPFWQSIHPITLALFLLTLALSWRSARRKYVLGALLGYLVVLVVTFIYFVPELIELVNTPYSKTLDAQLTWRASRWVNFSLVRAGILFLATLWLYTGLTEQHIIAKQPAQRKRQQGHSVPQSA